MVHEKSSVRTRVTPVSCPLCAQNTALFSSSRFAVLFRWQKPLVDGDVAEVWYIQLQSHRAKLDGPAGLAPGKLGSGASN
jgi:hypothetical protein